VEPDGLSWCHVAVLLSPRQNDSRRYSGSTALLLAGVLGGLGLFPSDAAACSCGWASDIKRLESADVVFIGRVESVDVPWYLNHPPDWPPAIRVYIQVVAAINPQVITTFKVEHLYKGDVGQHVRVATGTGFCCDCSLGPLFTTQPRWLVFASHSDGTLRTDSCWHSRSVEPDYVATDLGPEVPVSPEPDHSRYPGTYPWWIISILLVLAFIVVMWRRAGRHC